MKKSVICMFAFILSIAGCQKSIQNSGKVGSSTSPVELINIDYFPKELAGHWVSNKHGWELTIEENGQISSVMHTIGHFKVEPNKTERYKLINKGKGIIKSGPFKLRYDHSNKEIAIDIELKLFSYQTGKNRVEGHSNDLLFGFVSEDNKEMNVEWLSKTLYVISTNTVVAKELTNTDEYESHGEVIFMKVSDSEQD